MPSPAKKILNVVFDNQEKETGTIINKPGSKKLYVLFYYYGRRIEKSSGLDDTAVNRKKLRIWLNRQMAKIDDGTFVYAEAFDKAPEQEKAWFAQREGWDYQPEAKDVLFGDYMKQWMIKAWSILPEGTKKDDWKSAITYWILPYFSEKTFYQISGLEVKNFISTLKWKKGAKKGQLLSKKRVKNILVPLRAIWNDACEEFRWILPDPFQNIKKSLPNTKSKEREVFRFDEWLQLLEHLDPWYVPIVEFMILTGIISSEIAGLKKSHIGESYIEIKETIVRNRNRDATKTAYRTRRIPITAAIRERLDVVLKRSSGDYVFTKPTGDNFNASDFNKNVWIKALTKAELPHKVPYCMRHSFAAWSLTLKVDQLRLVNLMGHRDKKMIFEVYGNYVEGLEQDVEKILNYFGSDYIAPEIKQHAILNMQQSILNQLAIQMQQSMGLQQNQPPATH